MYILWTLVIAAMTLVILVELIATIRCQRERRRQTIAIDSGAAPAPPPSTPQSRGTNDTSKLFEGVAGQLV